MKPLIRLAEYGAIDLDDANKCLVKWEHKMGPFHRDPRGDYWCHGLFHRDEIIAVTITATIIAPTVGGEHGLPLSRENTIELARLCAGRPHICRLGVRMWRELFFPELGIPYAISYQDADIHSGATYRTDGWKRIGFSHSGPDRRSGKKGRNKWVWMWEAR